MKEAYRRWIADHVLSDPCGKCAEITRYMVDAFPELKRVRGHYVCPVDGRFTHWWLVAPDGRIVDPTSQQFASKGTGTYEPHVGPDPTGRCLNCGAWFHGDGWSCSPECLRELDDYYNRVE